MKLSELKLDLEAVDGGAWVRGIPDLEGVAFRVRGTEYEPYQKAMRAALATQGRRQRLQNQLDMGKFAEIQARLTAEHLLTDWDGLEEDPVGDVPGAKIPYTLALALEMMTNRAYKPLQRGVLYAVEMVDSGLAEHREEAAGN